VDPTPASALAALGAAADAPGYPAVWGTPELRRAIIGYLERRWNTGGDLSDECVLPVIGTKELVGWLPTLLGLGADDMVVIPELAYPTYEVGALSAGCAVARCDDPVRAPANTKLIWLNSPANPHGAILHSERLLAWIGFARAHGALLASDECYGEFVWEGRAFSVLDREVCGGDLTGLLAVHSVSKRSNMAGYRAGFVAGDPAIVMELLGVRKHLGMMMPTPVQAAMVAALADTGHVAQQRQAYARRRRILADGIVQAGYLIEGSGAGLYLWFTTEDRQDCWQTVADLASLGILVAPGVFYGHAGRAHVRMALTGSDRDVTEAAARLSGL
jgi:succinyldiaminopimelate transaminase